MLQILQSLHLFIPSSGAFSVKSAYAWLSNQDSGTRVGIFKMLWQTIATPRAQTTAWRILLDRLPTKNNLIRRGVIISSPLCVFCQATDESTQDLFCECAHTQRVWSLCYKWIGVVLAQHNELKCHFETFHLMQFTSKQNQLWKSMWVAIVRCILDQRNNIIFKQGVPDAEEIFHSAQLVSWLWLKHKIKLFTFALSDWILNPNQCIRSVD